MNEKDEFAPSLEMVTRSSYEAFLLHERTVARENDFICPVSYMIILELNQSDSVSCCVRRPR